ncbi:MAG: Crp/Fnr family transcriptional regulator [Bacteroidota bacterium]
MSIESEIEKYCFSTEIFWDNMPLSIYRELKKHSSLMHFKKNDIMYREGTIPKGLYIIKHGTAKLYLINADGKEQIVYFLTKGNFYGHRSMIGNNSSLFFITALEDCEVEIIDRTNFLLLIQNSITLNKLLLEHIGNEYRVLINKISFFTLKSVNERIAIAILFVNQKINSLPESKKLFYINKTDLANFAGTIPETLSRFLNNLKIKGIVDVKGRKIIINDREALIKMAKII